MPHKYDEAQPLHRIQKRFVVKFRLYLRATLRYNQLFIHLNGDVR